MPKLNRSRNRIVLVVPVFPKLSETFIANNFLGLLQKGWDIHVVCTRSQASDWTPFIHLTSHPGIRNRVHVTWPHAPRWIEIVLFPFALLKCCLFNFSCVLRYLSYGSKKLGPIRALHTLYLDANLIALRPKAVYFEFADLATHRLHLKELLECKILASFRGHELNFVGLHDDSYYNEIWNQADALHFMSKDLLSRARVRGLQDTAKCSVIPPSVDSTYFQPESRAFLPDIGTTERPMRILSVGRLEWSKGYEFGLLTMRLLMNQGVRFEYRIIGDGSYRQAILFAIRDLGLQDCVKLLYSKPPSEVRAEMQWADVFFHPSVSEGFGVVALEAQSMALPVVCSDADGLKENIVDGETGFVVPRRNPAAFAEKLILLCRDSVLRTKMSAAARMRAVSQFSVEDEIAAYDKFLSSALQLSPLVPQAPQQSTVQQPSEIV